jgi:Raf kinase inhibitor-like YbhB/YbcL family protein
MMRAFVPALLGIAVAACGAGNHATNKTQGGQSVDDATLTKIMLTSSAFQNGQPIPAQYTCDGANKSPPLAWDDPPQSTKSFALVIDDPDAPSGTFRHWGAYDIAASTRSIAAGQKAGTEVTNDMNKPGYAGPCPPPGHGVHHYHFKLFALDTDRLGLADDAKIADVENAANQHAIGKAELTGTYERK